MSSQFTAHLPAGSIRVGDTSSGKSEQPVVLSTLAKLTGMAVALLVLTPLWLHWMAKFAPESATFQAWGTLGLVALVGGGTLILVSVMFLRVWTGLLKYLALRD